MVRIGAYETQNKARDAIACLFIEFVAFSALGWLYESIYSSIVEQRFVNPGFLDGPYCPAYGFGVLAAIILFSKIENNFVFAVASAIVATIVEFIASVLLELIYHARWWDYSHLPLNFDGRICLGATILFGLGALLCVRVIHPRLEAAIYGLPGRIRIGLAIVLLAIILTDLITTHFDLMSVRDRIDELYGLIYEQTHL